MGKRKAFCAENLRALAILLLASAAVLMVCSMNSWLYPVNPWTDVNIISTVGRGLFDGLVPYRDLVEQKGPMLFAIFGLAELLFPGTYHGIYVMEVLFVAGALFFGWKTSRLYLPGLSPLWMVPLLAVLVGTPAFSMGASAEEFLLFPVAWSMYDLLAAWRTGKPLTSGALLRNGVLAGCVLWTKFNLLSFHFVWMAAVAIDALVKERKLWPPVKMCLIFLGGMALATVPWLVYFGANGAIGDFIQSYLIDNIFLYGMGGGRRSILRNIARWVIWLARENPLYMALLAVAGISVLAVPRAKMAVREKAMLVAAAALMAASMFSRWHYLPYYVVYLASFLPFALLPLAGLRRFGRVHWPRWAAPAATAAVIIASVGFGYLTCGESSWIGTPYSETPQARIAQAIEDSGVENPTMLHEHLMDIGFYFSSGARPADRWFTALNIRQSDYVNKVQEMIDEGIPDFIITSPGDPEHPQEFEGYDVVLNFPSHYGLRAGETVYYTLYQREGAQKEAV